MPLVSQISTEHDFPASRLQQQLYSVYRKNPLNTDTNLAFGFRAKKIDVTKLEYALNQIIVRHENLRSNFSEKDGIIWQHVHSERHLTVEQFSGTALGTFIRPFSIENDLLIRAAVKDDIILLDFCHIITDGFSMAIFFRELDSFYGEVTPNYLPPTAKDCIIAPSTYEENKPYWLTLLQEPFTPLSLPADFPKTQLYSGRGASEIAWLKKETTAKIREQCKLLSITPYIFYLSAFCRLLKRHCAHQDIITGTNVSCRGRKNLRSIGLYTTMVPVRVNVQDTMSTTDLLLSVNAHIKETLRHQHLDLEKILHEKNLHDYRDIFPTLFSFEHEKMAEIRLGGKPCTFVPVPTKDSAFDCNLCCFPFKENAGLLLIYRADLFTKKTASRYLNEYMEILTEMTETFAVPEKEKLQNSHC
ncbi:MAG: hypothetical protein IJS09_02205 [Treponema sp.]|nr:hypothetical protein [Treponema sp.]